MMPTFLARVVARKKSSKYYIYTATLPKKLCESFSIEQGNLVELDLKGKVSKGKTYKFKEEEY